MERRRRIADSAGAVSSGCGARLALVQAALPASFAPLGHTMTPQVIVCVGACMRLSVPLDPTPPWQVQSARDSTWHFATASCCASSLRCLATLENARATPRDQKKKNTVEARQTRTVIEAAYPCRQRKTPSLPPLHSRLRASLNFLLSPHPCNIRIYACSPSAPLLVSFEILSEP